MEELLSPPSLRVVAVPVPVPSAQSISCRQDGSCHTSQLPAGAGELQNQLGGALVVKIRGELVNSI